MQTDSYPTAQPIIQSLEQLIALAKSYISDPATQVDNEFIYQLGTLSAVAVNRMKAAQHPLYGVLAEAECVVYNNICDIIRSNDVDRIGVAHLENINKYIVYGKSHIKFKQILALRDDLRDNTTITGYIILCRGPSYIYVCYKNWSADTIADLRDTMHKQFDIGVDISFNTIWNGYQITFDDNCSRSFDEYHEDFRKMICEKLYDLEKDYCDDIMPAPRSRDRVTGKHYVCSLHIMTEGVKMYRILTDLQRQRLDAIHQPITNNQLSRHQSALVEPTEIIYAIVDEPYRNRVKIGRTEQTVDAHCKQLEIGAGSLKVIHSVTKTKYSRFEIYLYRLHAARRIHGEWFMFMEHELDDLIKTMV